MANLIYRILVYLGSLRRLGSGFPPAVFDRQGFSHSLSGLPVPLPTGRLDDLFSVLAGALLLGLTCPQAYLRLQHHLFLLSDSH